MLDDFSCQTCVRSICVRRILAFYYKDGVLVGNTLFKYYENGQIWSKENWKDGEKDGFWESFNKDGTINKERTGTYKDGKKVSN